MKSFNAAKMYQAIAIQTNLENASAVKIVQILMQNTIDKIVHGKNALIANNIVEKGTCISSAITSLDALQSSLVSVEGSQIAENLDGLYTYMMNRLIQANLHNDADILDEVLKLMMTVKEGWDKLVAEKTGE